MASEIEVVMNTKDHQNPSSAINEIVSRIKVKQASSDIFMAHVALNNYQVAAAHYLIQNTMDLTLFFKEQDLFVSSIQKQL
jgi:hypothetical protein